MGKGILVAGGCRGSRTIAPGGGSGIDYSSQISVENGSSVQTADGVAGMAIQTTDNSTHVYIQSGGSVTESIDLGSESENKGAAYGDITVNGTLNSGTSLDADELFVGVNASSAGVLEIAGPVTIGTTPVTNYWKSARVSIEGAWNIDALADQTADLLIVDGSLSTRGAVVTPRFANLLPQDYLIATVNGGGAPDADAWADTYGLLVPWANLVEGGDLYLQPQADFMTGYNRPPTLSPSERSVAGYLQSTWNSMWNGFDTYPAATQTLAPVFGDLAHLSDTSDYVNLLDQLSSQNIIADERPGRQRPARAVGGQELSGLRG